MRRLSGFSLSELLIVLGITLILIGSTATISNQAIKNGEFDRVRETVRNELTSAQADAMAGTNDASWGVKFTANTVTRYQGTSFLLRNNAFDRVTSFSNSVVISGNGTSTVDVPFTRPRGYPSASSTIVVSDGLHTATTTINPIGAITIQ